MKQGTSGLGLEAQRFAVNSYLLSLGGEIVVEFTEIESGRKDDRPKLDQAIAAARLRRLPLLVAKVDRLTRSVSFLSRLLEAGVDVRFADLPQIEGPTGRFILQQMVAVAELEAGLISSRTKTALAAAKARGQRLGGFRGTRVSESARATSIQTRVENAKQRAFDLRAIIDQLDAAGIRSANALAKELTTLGIPTASGLPSWTATQVIRMQNILRSK